MYYVEQKYLNSGRVLVRVFDEEDITESLEEYKAAKPECPLCYLYDKYDLYVDAFNSYEEAIEFLREIKNA